MSAPPIDQTQQHNADSSLGIGNEGAAVSEGFKDQSSKITTSFPQATTSTTPPVQQQQAQSTDLGSSMTNVGMRQMTANVSSAPTAEHSNRSDLSRSSSVGRPSLSGGECSTSRERSHLHAERHMWTSTETQALVDGCNKHGIGNWKAILKDQALAVHFQSGRTPGDLKDRFRTYFPDAYHELYPNAKTHTSSAIRSKAPDGKSIFEKGKTKERRPFTPAEDEVLRKGYEQFGSHWAVIARNAVFEGRRKSTDLRDRFRNAFPVLYEQAGYKPRTKSYRKERRPSIGNSSFSSQVDPRLALQSDWKDDGLQRPTMQPRSETSASAHSQAVSEYSGVSEEEDSSVGFDVYNERSDTDTSIGLQTQPGMQSATPPSMERSISHSSSRSDQVPSGSGTRSPPGGLAVPLAPPKAPTVLRRTQSTKKANLKVGSLDQAVKNAYTKSSKEAILASHQQHHLQHQQQLLQGTSHAQGPPSVAAQRPPLNQSVSAGWPPRFTWMPNTSTDPLSISGMDLDQMDEMINSHSATELLSGDDESAPMTDQVSADANTADEAMNVDEVQTMSSNSQVDFASLYQQLALAGSGDNAANRALSIDSFQDLLDPLLRSQNTGQAENWVQVSSVAPWTPVSSINATSSTDTSLQVPTNTATRREHEHNQWAGDLLHRGSYANQEQQQTNSQGFVSMASMHLSTSNQGVPASRSADDALGQASRNDLNRPTQIEQTNTTIERPALRPNEQGPYSTPSVHELLSRSTRRQSYPPRPVGFGEDGDEIMQSAYSNPYPYPADDISLLNSSVGGSMTLFPSLVSGQVNDYSQAAMMRRRRSTDTLREGAYNSFAPTWRGGLMDSAKQVEEQEENAKEGSLHSHREAASASSRHGTSEHSRSISDSHTNDDDDDDAPSRAASVGNMDLIGHRDNNLYAESLPDLTSGIEDNSAFNHHGSLQISYDDMDLPSFLNRSPNFLHAMTTSAMTSFSVRPGAEGGRQKNTAKAWSADESNGPTPAASLEQGSDSQGASKGPSKSVDWTNMTDFGSSTAWDRLEHLYLETGLQAPSSPLNAHQGLSASASAGNNTGYSMGNNQRRNPANNTGWSSGSNDRSNGAWSGSTGAGGGGGDAAGYESV